MNWSDLSEWAGFTDKKEVEVIDTKAMELNVQAPNKYIEQMIKTMWWKNDIRFDADSSSFVEDGYAGNVDIYSIINYVITTAANVPFKLQIKAGDTWEDDPQSELIKLISRPNALTNYSLFIEETLGWKMIDGSAFVHAPILEVGRNKGKATSMWTMPSTKMHIIGGDIHKPI